MSEKKKAEEILAELGKKIDELIAETKQSGAKVSEDLEKKIEKLRGQKDKLEEKLRDNGQTKEKWIQVREHLNDAAESLNKAFRGVLNKD